jgi:hypothetical protein
MIWSRKRRVEVIGIVWRTSSFGSYDYITLIACIFLWDLEVWRSKGYFLSIWRINTAILFDWVSFIDGVNLEWLDFIRITKHNLLLLNYKFQINYLYRFKRPNFKLFIILIINGYSRIVSQSFFISSIRIYIEILAKLNTLNYIKRGEDIEGLIRENELLRARNKVLRKAAH